MLQVFANRTIDDQFGDSVTGVIPSYNPALFWKPGASCGSNCSLHPDPAVAFKHTWHDSSQFPASEPVSVSLDFVGTAVWVFCIVPPLLHNDTITRYNLSFSLDNGAHIGRFGYSPTGGEFLYNVPVVSLPSLPNATHNLFVSTDDSVSGSVLLFDYAIYTSVEGKNDARISPGAIAGCVLGALFFIALIFALLYWRRRRNRKRQLNMVLDPFKTSNTYDSASGLSPPMPRENAPLDAPTALVRQLQQALDTVANMRQTNIHDGSTQGPGSTIAYTAGSASPPPVYQSRVAPVPPRLALKVANYDGQH
ncbi:hypothetical protein C8R47DRAFT_174881 [Mycena vitilis]|nr:hypothetical protein C8R47DRAFT_174881 [Mycena vitilis]